MATIKPSSSAGVAVLRPYKLRSSESSIFPGLFRWRARQQIADIPEIASARNFFLDGFQAHVKAFVPTIEISARVMLCLAFAIAVTALHFENLGAFDGGRAQCQASAAETLARNSENPMQRRRAIHADAAARFVPRKFPTARNNPAVAYFLAKSR